MRYYGFSKLEASKEFELRRHRKAALYVCSIRPSQEELIKQAYLFNLWCLVYFRDKLSNSKNHLASEMNKFQVSRSEKSQTKLPNKIT